MKMDLLEGEPKRQAGPRSSNWRSGGRVKKVREKGKCNLMGVNWVGNGSWWVWWRLTLRSYFKNPRSVVGCGRCLLSLPRLLLACCFSTKLYYFLYSPFLFPTLTFNWNPKIESSIKKKEASPPVFITIKFNQINIFSYRFGSSAKITYLVNK